MLNGFLTLGRLWQESMILPGDYGKKIKIYQLPVSITAEVFVSLGALFTSPFSSFELISVPITKKITTTYL